MNLKIKRVLAFTMVLTMLLGCFMFGTSAVEVPGGGNIVCSGNDSEDGVSFVVRTGDINDVANGYTMYLYDDGGSGNGGWGRPISATQWGTPTFDTDFTETGEQSVANWCMANVTTLVVHSGVVAFAGDAFKGYTKLEYVEVNTANITDVSTQPLFFSRGALFENCPLKAIYQTGNTPESGVADLTYLKFLGNESHGQKTPFYGDNTTIKTVKLGSEVYFYTPDPFNGLNGLKEVIIEATDAAKVTAPSPWFNANWRLTLPTGCTVECANRAVAEKFSSITCFDDTMVTYPGKESMAEILEKPSTDGKIKYSVAADGDGWCLTVGATVSNTEGKITSLSTAVAEYNNIKVYITKIVFDNSVKELHGDVCKNWSCVEEIILTNTKMKFSGSNIFDECIALKSIHPYGMDAVKGVADLRNVDEFANSWSFWNVSGITELVFGEELKFDSSALLCGMSQLDTITVLATDDAKINCAQQITGDDKLKSSVKVVCWTDAVKEKLDTSAFTPDRYTFEVSSSKYVGYQTKTNEADSTKNDIRFIAVIGEADVFDKVGFDIEVTNNSEKNGETTKVYSSIVGSNKDGSFTYTAKQLGGKYVYTLTITGVPAYEAIEFTVKPYVVKTGASEKIYGASGTVTIGGAN